jgi:hypothetical protein
MLTVFTPDFEIFPGTANTRPVRTSVKPFQFVVDAMANAE